MSLLEELVPPEKKVCLAGEEMVLTPLRVGQIPAVAKAIEPLLPYVRVERIDWRKLLAEQGEVLLEVLGLMVKKPRVWVDALAIHEAVVLAATLLELNADFFIQTLLPTLERLSEQVATLTPSTD